MKGIPDWLRELNNMREDKGTPLPSVPEISHRILQDQINTLQNQINTLKKTNLRTLDVIEKVAIKVAELIAMEEKIIRSGEAVEKIGKVNIQILGMIQRMKKDDGKGINEIHGC